MAFLEKVKDFIKKYLLLIMLITSGVLVVAGIVFIILAIAATQQLFYIIMFIIMAITMILLGCVMVYFVFLVKGDADKEEPNLFLYDPKTEKNMDESVLTFDLINKRMVKVMSGVSGSIKELWTTNVFADDESFDNVDELKALLAYKMLYDLTDRDIPALWDLYANASEELIDEMVECIAYNEGDPLGKYIKERHGNLEKSKKFLANNKQYIERKMLSCVQNNIEKF